MMMKEKKKLHKCSPHNLNKSLGLRNLIFASLVAKTTNDAKVSLAANHNHRINVNTLGFQPLTVHSGVNLLNRFTWWRLIEWRTQQQQQTTNNFSNINVDEIVFDVHKINENANQSFGLKSGFYMENGRIHWNKHWFEWIVERENVGFDWWKAQAHCFIQLLFIDAFKMKRVEWERFKRNSIPFWSGFCFDNCWTVITHIIIVKRLMRV